MTMDGRRVLAVCPARGGSKGIHLKNLRPVGGVPMVARVGHLCAELDWLDRAVVSTDHDEIAAVAEQSGLAAPFRRPESIAGDQIGDWDVLHHALLASEEHDGVTYDIVVMLQPTSPLRDTGHITKTVKALIDGDWDACWTVSETDSKAHPLKQLAIHDGRLDFNDAGGAAIIARQQLAPVYHRNGLAYAITRPCLVQQKTIMGRRTHGLVTPGHFVSIDTEFDIALVELLMNWERRSQV
ncbi:MAG: CMP-N-acetylneuraminic acid synthetase [Rhodospirillaceae bacterium]|nr:CMP-N-acetylneuraminic acid synthetase [Rhodospirillaceae bacterium]|tara:strand:- start:1202 stop:1921 length:720 start_codon:yes stop_codon:yes gene_type:complete